MAFDQPTRNRLARFVREARSLLTEEFERQLQNEYGLDPDTGEATELERLPFLDDARRETAHLLRETLEHYLAAADTGTPTKANKARQEALGRIVREQAFTVLNRLCAVRMAEARGLLIESIANGYQSKGFQLYQRVAGTALGETGDCYRHFLFSVFDEFAIDLAVLFDRFSPQGRLFPRPTALLNTKENPGVLDLITAPDIDALWTEDETIGWIYQFFNPKELKYSIKKETKVPRNSYEITVRSSYYTPRFVVEFLTDNTLGRIWYEMRKGDTNLKDECRHLVQRPNEVYLAQGQKAPVAKDDEANLDREELLRRPVYVDHQPKKDPRDLCILDPACGSGHFLLYAFDLLERIYEEAWGDPVSPRSQVSGGTLQDDFKTLDDLRREAPKLIVEHNLHGIDIDARSVQIAALALWLRGQKAWKNLGIKADGRPRITRSNIVTAEPMPGEADMLDDFAERLQPRVLGQLVKIIFEKMKLAGEAGSLLKIEEEIKDTVAAAHKEYQKFLPQRQERAGFLPGFAPRRETTLFDFADLLKQEDFWRTAELRVVNALRSYAEQASGHSYQRRLFAADAARGFAFIDLCLKRYDVVLMNPPYAETEGELQAFLRRCYPANWTNLYSAFIERGLAIGRTRVGFVCPDGFLSAYRMKNLRGEFVEQQRLEELTCLGKDVFNEMGLATIAMVLNCKKSQLQPLLVDLSETGLGRVDLIDRAVVNARTNHILTPDLIRGGKACWGQKPLSPTFGVVTQGNRTFEDFRFIRTWWEVPVQCLGGRWQRWQKGGEYQPFFSSTPYVIDWERQNDGAEMRCYGFMKVGTDAQVAQSSGYWWQSGLVGPAMNTTGAGFNVRVLPKNEIFSAKSTVIIPKGREQALILLALLNSRVLRWLLYQQGAGLAGNTGKIKALPIVWPREDVESSLTALSQEAVTLMADLEAFRETSPCFKGVVRPHDQLAESYRECAERLDAIVSVLYQQEVQDEAVRTTLALSESALLEATDGHITRPHGDSLLAYCIGMLFGRWDIRFALDPSLTPKLPDPFEPLPICPPGTLVRADGLPAELNRIASEEWLRARPDANTLPPEGSVKTPMVRDSDYPLRISWSGVLVDDESHPEDVVARIRASLDVVWKERAESIEQEACEILGVTTLREYFQRPGNFFADHLKRYSKSRRQAPIYWPLSTPSGSYTLWLYYHLLTDQTLYSCVNNLVEPKLKQVADEAMALRRKANRSTAEEKEMERLSSLELELVDFQEELLRVARFWRPNLNDGVQITAAPLWRLFQHKPWQKKLKETWEKLEAAEYDWAHLALAIWPDRVVRASHKDRSLAIAHDLEDRLWHEAQVQKTGRGGKVSTSTEWQPRDLSESELRTIVEQMQAR